MLIGFSLLVAVSFLIAFLVAVKKGQYNDTYTPSVRILLDDKEDRISDNSKNHFDENGNQNNAMKNNSASIGGDI